MTEIDYTFIRIYESFKYSVEKLIPISVLLLWKTTESVGYDVVRPYEQIISPEATSWSVQEDYDKLIGKNQLVVFYCCVYLILSFWLAKAKAEYCWQHYQHFWVPYYFFFHKCLGNITNKIIIHLTNFRWYFSFELHLYPFNLLIIWPWPIWTMISYFQWLDGVSVKK